MATPQEIEALVKELRPLLAGKPPEVQGAALAILTTMFITGHNPMVRGQVLRIQFDTVQKLRPSIEAEMISDGLIPPEWRTAS